MEKKYKSDINYIKFIDIITSIQFNNDIIGGYYNLLDKIDHSNNRVIPLINKKFAR